MAPPRQCRGCMSSPVPLHLLCSLLPSFVLSFALSDLLRACAPPYRLPVQSAAPTGDDGQLMSSAFCGPAVLSLGTNAVHVFFVNCFPSNIFRQVFSGKRLPSSVFCQLCCSEMSVLLGNVRHLRDGILFSKSKSLQVSHLFSIILLDIIT